MTNEEKINILTSYINNLNIHISVLETDISDNPNADYPGKPLRQDVLNDFYAKKRALLLEIDGLTV